MAKIIVNNPRQVINGGAKKYYFKVKGLGGPKGDKGDTGATGPQGPQGPQGNAATVSVGSTTTLPVGQDASVENVGSIYNAVLNFGIPQGPQGPQGAKGDKGDTGAQGETGPRGPQGERGANATVYIGTTTTGEPGTQASVYNSGTESNAVLNFTIPRGDVGPSVPLVQETGNSTTKAMSQNATTEALNGKQNTLTAGSNIQISGSTISATDTKYSAGNGITLTGTQFSANTSVLATKNDLGSYYTKTQIDSQMAAKQDDLVAGSNIQIAPDGKTISATDTTYTAGNGLNLNDGEFSADTTVLATKEDLEGYYAKPETDNLLAPKLEAEVVAELPTAGEEGKLYLTPKAHTAQTATGNPITATVAEEAGALESFQLDGDTFQQSYDGKNLFGSALELGNYSTQSGLPIAGDGNTIRSAEPTPVTAGETYTASAVGGGRIAIRYYLADGSFYGSGTTTVSPNTFTVPDTVAKVNFVIPENIDTNTKFQLEVGSSATDYEPFVGGQASPNPEYPQPIQTVTGLQTIEIVGKNLLGLGQPVITQGLNMSVDAENNNIAVSGTATGSYPHLSDKSGLNIPAGTYTFSIKNAVGYSVSVRAYRDDGTYPTGIGSFIPAGSTSCTFTIDFDCHRVGLLLGGVSSGTVVPQTTISDIMLEAGSTAGSFAPYSHQTLPLDLGKNLFDKSIVTVYGGYFNAFGVIKGAQNPIDAQTNRWFYVPCMPNTTYTITKPATTNISDNRFRVGTTASLPSDGAQLSDFWYAEDGANITTHTITTSSSAKYLCIYYGKVAVADSADILQYILDGLQIEAGSTATTYAPYKTPTELCKLGTYQDYIYKDGNDWKIHKATASDRMASADNWVIPNPSSYPNLFQAVINRLDLAPEYVLNSSALKALCEKLTYMDSGAVRTAQGFAVYNNEGSKLVRINHADFTTVTQLKDWLSNNNVEILFALATPTDTVITNTTLIAQLEAIRTAMLQNGANTITNTATGSNLAGDMEIGYYGFAPRNRYDKWLWLDINNEYEQIGS